jgi:transcriptional regulator with XRE-family HTH domain
MPEEVSGLRLRLFFHPYPQYIVARKCSINKSVLSQYSLGHMPIPPRHLIELANYFDCSPEELLEFVVTDAFDPVVTNETMSVYTGSPQGCVE